VGRDLNVRYLVEGSVARSGKDVRVNVQLIDAATGSQLWAERFVRERDALPAWQDEIVAGIASALNFRLTRIESDRALRERPRNPEAYDLTTRGWALIYTAKKPENYAAARALFDQALLRDPQAVNALAGVGWVCVLSVLNGWSASPADDLAIAKRAAEQLLAIDPNHVMAHHVRGVGLRLERRTEAARDAFRTAVTLNPNFAPGHAQLGMAELELGRPEESIRAVERATRLSPRDPNVGHWIAFIGMAELHRGRYAEAVAWLTRSVNTGTASPTVLQRAYLIGALALAGRKAEAQGALTELLKAKPGTTIALLQRNARSTDARFVAQQQRLYEGLRLAGLPE
jgi:tetratricopeptide (TPR) repeat protein